jgi:hypothetical protein
MVLNEPPPGFKPPVTARQTRRNRMMIGMFLLFSTLAGIKFTLLGVPATFTNIQPYQPVTKPNQVAKKPEQDHKQ